MEIWKLYHHSINDDDGGDDDGGDDDDDGYDEGMVTEIDVVRSAELKIISLHLF